MVSLIAYKCFATKILFCLSNSQILQQLLNLLTKHQNSINSKNPHMYSWKIIHRKHKRITLQSLINGNAFCNMLSLFCRLQKITRRREKSNYCKEQSFCETIMMIYTRHLLQHVLVEKNRCYFSE